MEAVCHFFFQSELGFNNLSIIIIYVMHEQNIICSKTV